VAAAFATEAARRGHEVTLVTTKGEHSSPGESSSSLGKYNFRSDRLNIFKTVNASWDDSVEKDHYLLYKSLLEKEYGDGKNAIVWDNTNRGYAYLSLSKYGKIKLLHTRHGLANNECFDIILNTKFPRVIGVSRVHAHYLACTFNIQTRYVFNGIPLPIWNEKNNDNSNCNLGFSFSSNKHNEKQEKEDYLLSLNRISREKGIHHAINLAIATHNHIRVVGDDVHVSDPLYIEQIIKQCSNSRGYAEYYGLVDNKTKEELLKNCKGVVGCPEPYWMEAFGLWAVEANAYGKPVLALRNGGLKDIVVDGINGFLGDNLEELKGYVEKIHQCTPEACRKRVEEMFTDEIMTNNYLSIFEHVLNDDPGSRW
jgi:glycosyltransferase involved in cell wall biosynthesis